MSQKKTNNQTTKQIKTHSKTKTNIEVSVSVVRVTADGFGNKGKTQQL